MRSVQAAFFVRGCRAPRSSINAVAAETKSPMFDSLLIETSLATMDPRRPGAYGAIRNGAIGVKDGRIAFVGPQTELSGAPEALARDVIRLGGAEGGSHAEMWATPGLVDCHTHLVFAGDRASEFEQRLLGATYEEIARAGGGILSTVKATRETALDELTGLAEARMRRMLKSGVTTLEFKSGYGLDRQTECRMLEAGTEAARRVGVRARRTFLALHALPPEYGEDRRRYVEHAAGDMLDMAMARGLVDAVDAFCEGIAFSHDEVRTLFDAAKAKGIPVKLHAEQLSDTGGARLAAEYAALSADHLEHVSADAVAAMARAGTVAVLLPGAYYFLKDEKKPPVDLFRKSNVKMAVATDFNPGSSPISSITLAMNLAATLFGLTPEECLAGATRNAAAALGLGGEIGTLEVGKAADIAVWRVSSPAALSYWVGGLEPEAVFIGGSPAVKATQSR